MREFYLGILLVVVLNLTYLFGFDNLGILTEAGNIFCCLDC
jgi:hypothetical protein